MVDDNNGYEVMGPQGGIVPPPPPPNVGIVPPPPPAQIAIPPPAPSKQQPAAPKKASTPKNKSTMSVKNASIVGNQPVEVVEVEREASARPGTRDTSIVAFIGVTTLITVVVSIPILLTGFGAVDISAMSGRMKDYGGSIKFN